MRAGLDYRHIPVNYGTLLHDRYLCFKILYFCHLLDYVKNTWPRSLNIVLKKMTQKCAGLYNDREDLRMDDKD